MRWRILLGAFATAALSTTAGAGIVQPGMWRTTTTVTAVDMPGAPSGIAQMMKGHPNTFTHCVTPDEAAKDPRALISNDKSCQFKNYSMAGGKLDATMICNHGGGATTISTSGNYTPTSYTAVSHVVDSSRGGMNMTASVSSTLVGACK
ncbi:MAG: DUF3617 domain-containing protein [Sphingomonadaceae bacterium]|nr:DUF3617 domain-containing protein [Sphingomonadaceae bacterium]